MLGKAIHVVALSLVAASAFADIAFLRHEIDPAFTNGYQVTIADIDSDGKPDVIALSTEPSRLVWYRNPDWQRFDITTQTRKNIDAAPYDIDGDGDQDLALASDVDLGNTTSGGTVEWLECPPDPATNQEWTRHPICSVPTAHRVRWADLDGDGRKELVVLPIVGSGAKAPDYEGPVDLYVHAIPDDLTKDWQHYVIDQGLELAHGMRVAAWTYRGPDSLLVASFDGVTLFRSAKATKDAGFDLEKSVLCKGHIDKRPMHGASEVDFGSRPDPEGPVRFIATIEPWHGNEVVVYTPVFHTSKPWSRQVIDDSLKDGHALACADFDGDGCSEIAAGGRGCGLYLYRLAENAWKRSDIDTGGISAAGIIVCDLDQDGDPDLVATGTATHNVIWYENVKP